jgi:hypothetical protein
MTGGTPASARRNGQQCESHYGPGGDSDSFETTRVPQSLRPTPAKTIISKQTQSRQQSREPEPTVGAPTYEKYPLIGIESVSPGNNIAFQLLKLCETSRQPQLSKFIEGKVVSVKGYMVTVIVSTRSRSCNSELSKGTTFVKESEEGEVDMDVDYTDGDSLQVFDSREIAVARLVSESSSCAALDSGRTYAATFENIDEGDSSLIQELLNKRKQLLSSSKEI